MAEKYTMRKFLETVATGLTGAEEVEFAKGEIAKLDARNEARKGKPSKTAQVNAPIKDAIKAFVTDNPNATAEAIGVAIGQTTAKVSSLATQLVNEGILASADIKKVNGKGKVKSYIVV
jgi:hypothetical protein